MTNKHDPFVKGLKARLPDDIKESFTEEQLEALKIAFGARKWGKHPLDIRGTFRIWRTGYYFVVLAGKNRRELSRLEKELSLVAKTAFFTCTLLVCSGLGLLILYLIKSAAGIDLLPGVSLGIWDWFKSL